MTIEIQTEREGDRARLVPASPFDLAHAAIELRFTGTDRVVRTQLVRDSEPVSGGLPGDLSIAAGRLLGRLASEASKRIVAAGGLSQFSHPGRRPPSDGAPVCWRSPSYRGVLRHLIRFPRGKSRQDWPRAPAHQLLSARSTAELSSDFLMYRCVRARTSTGSWQVKRIEKTTPAPQGRDLQRVWLLAERAAWAFGLAALAIWGVVNLAGVEGTREDLARFEALRHARLQQRGVLRETPAPDVTEWDLKRVREWRAVLKQPAPGAAWHR
jgi:hypothetical protein